MLSSFNDAIDKSDFPTTPKQESTTLVFKKDTQKIITDPQVYCQMCQKLLKNVCFFKRLIIWSCFRKGCNTRYCLLKMLEKWKLTVDKGKSFGVLLTDLSKAFDCLLHDHLLAKLHCYRFSLPALKLIHSYLQNRKQRTKINSTYHSWEEILFRIPQGSILGTLLFNIFYV